MSTHALEAGIVPASGELAQLNLGGFPSLLGGFSAMCGQSGYSEDSHSTRLYREHNLSIICRSCFPKALRKR
jgi:hypothetical protein